MRLAVVDVGRGKDGVDDIAMLGGEGLIETVGGRLRVTRAGFPILDAVVADLAA